MAVTLEELQIIFRAEMGNVKEQIGGIQSQLSGFEQSAVKSQKTLGLFGKAAIVAGVVKAGKAMVGMGKEAMLMANDVVESEQLFEISLGKMADKATAWSDEVSGKLGLNPYEIRKNTGVMNVMLESMGMTSDEAYKMSTDLTMLAEDMGSFYNIDPSEAFNKLQSGMTGMGMPLKQLGILVDEETIKQYAMANGISKTGKEMTQQQKVMARYGTIMEQTRKAQGDLARTLDSPTNQLRILNNQFDQAKIALGQALQPALIAVLPHVTRFATGLAGLMTGNTDPLAGTMVSLANATTAIQSRIDLSIVDIVADVKQGQADTEAAIDEYIDAVQKTRQLYLNLTMKPQNTVFDRIEELFEELEELVGEEAAEGIEDDILIMMNAALEDGEVTKEEVEAIRARLTEKIQKLLDSAETEKNEAKAVVQTDLAAGIIDEDTAATRDKQIEDAYKEKVAGIEAVEVSIAAELGISKWKAKTISADDRDLMAAAINEEIAAGEALLVSANAQVQALFEGSSLEEAVLGMYGGLTDKIKENNAEINELLTAWLDEDDGTALEKAMAKREENKKLLAIASGGLTAEGKINKALLAIGGATPEEITNFAKGYKDIFGSMTEGYIELGKERENVLYNMPDSYFAEQGKTRQQMLDINKAETNAAIAQANAMLLKSVTEGIGPQISKILNDPNVGYAQTLDMSIAIGNLLRGIDIKGLDTAGIEQYDALKKMLSDLDTLMTWQQNRDVIPFPGSINPWQSTAIPEIIIDKPKVELKDPGYVSSKGWMSPGSMPPQSVNVEVTPNPVTLYLDGYVVAQSTVTYTPKVVRSAGGGGAPKPPMMELN